MINEQSLQYYLNQAQKLEKKSNSKQIKIGIISSYTINGLAETLQVKCAVNDVNCRYYVGAYNQYSQEIISKDSGLYKFNPDVVFLLLDTRSLFGNVFYDSYSLNLEERKLFVKEKFEEIENLINHFSKNFNSKLIVSNFTIPSYSSFGINETKQDYGFHEMILSLNSKLNLLFREKNNVYIFDFNSFSSKHGQKNIFNYKNFLFGDIQIDFDYIPYLAHELQSYINAFLGITKKCIVLDLDNTLWGGIIGEDGFEKIQLGPQPPGNAYYEFQKFLKALKQRGIILAINSKNNLEDALKVIREHPYMILQEEDFSCLKINWQDKVKNLKEISKELNIGLDGIVFFDDDKINCEYVNVTLPQVKVVNLSGDPSFFPEILQNMNDFESLKITNEDLKRTQMYSEQIKRDELKDSSISLNDFLKNLAIKIIIKKSDNFLTPRISQLTLKTNQFNLTTKRYQEEDIHRLTNDPNFIVGCAQVKDKFGDSGITGVFIVNKQNSDEWHLDSFLLSCRIMGREIEKSLIAYVIDEAKKNNVKKIIAEYIPTQKNKPSENFLSECGFLKYDDKWIYDVSNSLKLPEFLSVKVENE
jgi:FkbH-like protein